MTTETDVIDAAFDFVFPNDLGSVDGLGETVAVKPSTRPSLASLNRSHSLEPPEFDVEMPINADNDMEQSFQAALQFLEETEGLEGLSDDLLTTPTAASATGNGGSSSTSVSDLEEATEADEKATADTTEPTASKRKRRQRVSTKQQISSLRGTVKQLSDQLQSLGAGAAPANEAEEATAESNGRVPRVPLWQQIAARQLERRQEAERDNAKLREMLDIQVQEAKNLKRILKRRTRIEMLEDMLGVKRHKMLENEKADNSLGLLHAMLRSTDEMYVGVDHDLEINGMGQVPCPGKTRRADRNATNAVFLELLEKQLVPFGVKETEKAVWAALSQVGMQALQCVKDMNAHVDFYAQDSQQTDDTMMISYVAATAGFRKADLTSVRVRKAMRKYVEANRAVFVCRLETQPQHANERKGIKLRCNLRVVVQSLPDEEGEMTLIKSHYSVSRHAASIESFQHLSANADMAIAVWDETIARVSEDVESILLNGAMKTTPTTQQS